jgi:putative flippase GtrA
MKTKKNFKEYGQFLLAGISATLAQYLALYLLVDYSIVPILFASILGYIMGGIVNYLINYYITFNSSKKHKDSLISFSIVVAIGLIINTSIFSLMLNQLGLYYLLSQIVASVVVLFWNYWAHKKWTF